MANCVGCKPSVNGYLFIDETESSAVQQSLSGNERTLGPAYANRDYIDPEGGWKPQVGAPETLYESFSQAVSQYGSNPCLSYRPGKYPEANRYVTLTYDQVNMRVNALSEAFKPRLNRGAAVGIYAFNCLECILTTQVCNRMAYISVPLYDSLPAEKVQYIIKHADCEAIALSSDKLPTLATVLSGVCDTLKLVMYWGDTPSYDVTEPFAGAGVELVSIEDLEGESRGESVTDPPPNPDDICTIMYTSGTTGQIKGALLTHRAMAATIAAFHTKMRHEGITMDSNTRYLSYLPLAHIFDRASEECVLAAGGHIGFWRGKVRGLIDDLNAFKPTYMAGVPIVYNQLYTKASHELKRSAASKTIYAVASFRKRMALNAGREPRRAGGIWDALVFQKIAAIFGGQVKLLVCGGARLAPHIEDFLRLGSCALVGQGYGLTETCAGATLVNPREPLQAGTVGVPLPGMQIRLAAVPEMGHDPLANPPRGEILLKGPQLFSGYHKQEELTRQVMTEDGWLITGDIGEFTPAGSLKIIDRVKDIFKLPNGEFVSVERLENVYMRNVYVDEIWVYGHAFDQCLVAVVLPLAEPLVKWAEKADLSTNFEELCASKAAREHVLGSLQVTGKQRRLLSFEQVRNVWLVPDGFSVANGLRTPSYKLKRRELLERFQQEVNDMFEEVRGTTQKSL